ncbi:polysaccharide deacetylase family protein [Kibdelosporangium lantanae]
MKAAAVAAATLLAVMAAPASTFVTPVRALLPRLRGVGSPGHVALTFDDGPDTRATPLLLDLLAKHRVRATFFMMGEQLTANRRLGKEIAAAGHEVAVHAWRHLPVPLRRPKTVHDDITRTYDLIADVTGTPPRWYRPPYGVLAWPALSAIQRLGLTPVLWTSWGRDWTAGATPESVYRRVRRGLENGPTVLLHDSDRYAAVGSWRATFGAVSMLLDECERRQLTAGPLSEHGLESTS